MYICRAVTDPRTGKRLALKKLLNIFQSLVSCTRVYRELLILCRLRHENVSITYCCFCLAWSFCSGLIFKLDVLMIINIVWYGVM